MPVEKRMAPHGVSWVTISNSQEATQPAHTRISHMSKQNTGAVDSVRISFHMYMHKNGCIFLHDLIIRSEQI